VPKTWEGELVRVDINPDHKPDVELDLMVLPYPFEDEEFDELHFYDVLEHLWTQGDYHKMFALFTEFWRILKPGGLICGISPWYASPWAWGDPSHRNICGSECLTFLDQREYEKQVGRTPMSDFRWLWKRSFQKIWHGHEKELYAFILEKA
jgi:SAM-dependent methyltransferase